MKLSDQVCTIQQARALKELGIENALFFWREYRSPNPMHTGWKVLTKQLHEVEWEYGLSVRGRIEPHIETVRNTYACGPYPYGSASDFFPAFTVAELGVALIHYALPEVVNGRWRTEVDGSSVYFETEAEARAALLIHILTKRYQSIETTKELLTRGE